METKYHPNGAVKSIMYMVNGRVHRDDGPADLQWDIAGVLRVEEWYQNGSMHRDNGVNRLAKQSSPNHFALQSSPNHFALQNGPAYRQWNAAGELIRVGWYQHDRCHRDDGPAYQEWDDAGELIREVWYQNDRELTPQEIVSIVQPVDIMTALQENLPQPIFEEIAAVYRAV